MQKRREKRGITKTYQEHNTHYLRTTNLKRENEIEKQQYYYWAYWGAVEFKKPWGHNPYSSINNSIKLANEVDSLNSGPAPY